MSGYSTLTTSLSSTPYNRATTLQPLQQAFAQGLPERPEGNASVFLCLVLLCHLLRDFQFCVWFLRTSSVKLKPSQSTPQRKWSEGNTTTQPCQALPSAAFTINGMSLVKVDLAPWSWEFSTWNLFPGSKPRLCDSSYQVVCQDWCCSKNGLLKMEAGVAVLNASNVWEWAAMLVKPYSGRSSFRWLPVPWYNFWTENQGSPWRCKTSDDPLIHTNGYSWSDTVFHSLMKWVFAISNKRPTLGRHKVQCYLMTLW